MFFACWPSYRPVGIHLASRRHLPLARPTHTGPLAEEQVLHVRTFAMGRAQRPGDSGRRTGSARGIRTATTGVPGATGYLPQVGERGVRVVEPAEPRHFGVEEAAESAGLVLMSPKLAVRHCRQGGRISGRRWGKSACWSDN